MQNLENSKNNLIFIRHAQSQFNLASQTYHEQNNVSSDWKSLCNDNNFLNKVKYNNKLLDCGLTTKGIKQCSYTIKCTQYLHPDIILVSPLQRALQTCQLLFPYSKNKQVQYIVEPLLSQALRSSCDIGRDIDDKKKRYQKMNFDPLHDNNLWYIDNECEQNKNRYLQMLKLSNHTSLSYKEKSQLILQFMKKTMIYETPLSLRLRCIKIKTMLKKYQQKYNTIVIISHYNTINYFNAKKFNNQTNEPQNCLCMSNCQILQTNLSNIKNNFKPNKQ